MLFLVPGDPEQRTGGYRYVSRLVGALNGRGFSARVQGLEGRFPIPDLTAEAAMDAALSDCFDGAGVVLDGLAMGGLPAVVEKHAPRLAITALVHHPLADETGLSEEEAALLFESESRALAAVNKVITTSRSTALRLADLGVPSHIIRVVEPGADTVPVQVRQKRSAQKMGLYPQHRELQILCVASLSPRKAQHQLVEALAGIARLPWHCTLVGSTERSPGYSRQLAGRIDELSLADRITLAGELGDEDLSWHYSQADLFVLPSLYEGYGMVVDEALAAGLPVITTDGGALAVTGSRPGVAQYPAGSIDDLRNCLQGCLSDRQLLSTMTEAARQTGSAIRLWADAAEDFERAITVKDHSQFDSDWLSLREPADHRARNRELLTQVQRWSHQNRESDATPLQVADLGSGAGSNGVFLGDSLGTRQHWTLLDQNPDLLAEAAARLATVVAGLDLIECTLDAGNLSQQIPADAGLITASALIDLMSVPWLDALADAACARRAAVYIVLSYAGEFSISPPHPDDGLVRELVNQHQHGDKGSGAALGPEATDYLRQRLEAKGYGVAVAPSPWRLDHNDSRLQAALIGGWYEAALEQNSDQQARLEQWQSARLALAEWGELAVQVSHSDLFAWPLAPGLSSTGRS